MKKLPNDATLEFIINNGLLNKPLEWVSAVSNKMRALPTDRGPYCVRIGVSGTGHSPNYRIEPISKPDRTPEDNGGNVFEIPDTPYWEYLAAINTAYNGRNHETLVSGLVPENWSTQTSTQEEVNRLLLQCWRAPRKGSLR